jgi:hypothetical protein
LNELVHQSLVADDENAIVLVRCLGVTALSYQRIVRWLGSPGNGCQDDLIEILREWVALGAVLRISRFHAK